MTHKVDPRAWPNTYHCIVYGTPRPQGSKKHIGNNRFVEASKHVKPWRKLVTETAAQVKPDAPIKGPVTCQVQFLFSRPQTHYLKGALREGHKESDILSSKTDVDKLSRAILDSLTDAKWWIDDKQVANLYATKRWTTSEDHVVINVVELTESVSQ